MSFGFDANLGSKIDEILAGRPSAKQRVEEFLVDELHVDPSKIPLSLRDAKTWINTKMSERDAGSARFQGTSMGLSYTEFFKQDQEEPDTCPNCSNTGGYSYRSGSGKANEWTCGECDSQFIWKPTKAAGEKITERSHPDLWVDLLRAYTAFVKGVYEPATTFDDDGTITQTAPERRFTKFEAVHHWGDEAAVVGIADPKLRWKKPDRYPTGTRLRVTDGTEMIYVRIGGLFDDNEIVNLASMKPIGKVAGWTVTEVLDDEGP